MTYDTDDKRRLMIKIITMIVMMMTKLFSHEILTFIGDLQGETDYTGGDTIPKLVKVYKNNEMDKKEDSQDEDDNI